MYVCTTEVTAALNTIVYLQHPFMILKNFYNLPCMLWCGNGVCSCMYAVRFVKPCCNHGLMHTITLSLTWFCYCFCCYLKTKKKIRQQTVFSFSLLCFGYCRLYKILYSFNHNLKFFFCFVLFLLCSLTDPSGLTLE